MATRAQDWEEPQAIGGAADADHDAFVRAKVLKGLEQSRDRAAMIPIEQVWLNLPLAEPLLVSSPAHRYFY